MVTRATGGDQGPVLRMGPAQGAHLGLGAVVEAVTREVGLGAVVGTIARHRYVLYRPVIVIL